MQATTETVKRILIEARQREKHLEWELEGQESLNPLTVEALFDTQETIELCKARLAQEAR